MRKLLLTLSAACFTGVASAQQAIDFENLMLPGSDTFYVNYSQSGADVGFSAGTCYFQCVYDTAFGGLWSQGFAYSNMTDSITSGYMNQYSAKPAKGYNGSNNYLVYWNGYGPKPKVILPGDGEGPFVKRFNGFYVTNNTYAYNSMRDGDFIGKKFGGVSGTDPDWFKLTVRGYFQGQMKPDSVEFYLADFRFANSSDDYIVKDWRWVNVATLGNVDSLEFSLTSSDNNPDPALGMNTPAYFCMDNLTTLISTGVGNAPAPFIAKVYPVPAVDELFVDIKDNSLKTISVVDATGRLMSSQEAISGKNRIATASFPSGIYILQLNNGQQVVKQRFVKK